MEYAVYQAWNKITGESYIGVTRQDFGARIRQHERLAARGAHESPKFGEALIRYGFDNFSWSIIEYVDNPLEAEEYYIRVYRSVENGYNTKYGERDSVTNKRVICLTTDECFNSVTSCADHYGLSITKVAAVCRGSRGTTGGMVFRYLDGDDQPIIPDNAKIGVRTAFVSTTGSIFRSIREVSEYSGLTLDTIRFRLRKYGYLRLDNETITRM